MANYSLDAKNLMCPLPVIRTQDRIKSLITDDELTVLCTDPGALNDIPAWARINGHHIVSTDTSNHTVSITVRVGELE